MEAFNKLANRYDAWYDSKKGKPLFESEVLCLRPLIAELSAPLLEIGVGTGRFATRFPEAVGLDPALGVLRIASKRGVPSVLGIGEKLPFKDESFGGVLIILTLCFVKNSIEVLRESWRVLCQSGILILGTIPKNSYWGAFYLHKKKAGSPFFENANFYKVKEIKEILKRSGFRIEKIYSTLLQRPEEKSFVEETTCNYEKKAGFVCISARKNRNFYLHRNE